MKPLHLRDQARNDADEAAVWYAEQGGLALELAFVDALETVCELIRQHPDIGSTRHAEHTTDLPTPLRFLPLKHFERYFVYYINLPDRVEVIRVWHSARGLTALMDNEK